MDLFAEEELPLGFRNFCPDVCTEESERLERAFDVLKYRHLFKRDGVPLEALNVLLPQPLRILGNTSSGSPVDVFSTTLLPPFDVSVKGENPAYDSTSSPSTFRYIAAMVTIFGFLAKYLSRLSRRHFASLPRVDRPWKGNDDWNCGEPKLVVGILMNPEPPIEQLFEEDPLLDTYTPYVVLKFYDHFSDPHSDVKWKKDDSAPDGFAALSDAPQDALPSLKELRGMAESFLRNLPRFVIFALAIILCFELHVMVFFVKGRFGRRGIKQLVKNFKNFKPPTTPKKSLRCVTGSEISKMHTPSPCGSSSVTITPDSLVYVDDIVEISANGSSRLINPIASDSPGLAIPIASDSALIDKTVETSLAPVVNEGRLDDESRGRKRKGKASAVVPVSEGKVESSVGVLVGQVAGCSTPCEAPLPFVAPRKHGRRGRGHGRRRG